MNYEEIIHKDDNKIIFRIKSVLYQIASIITNIILKYSLVMIIDNIQIIFVLKQSEEMVPKKLMFLQLYPKKLEMLPCRIVTDIQNL